MSKRANRLKKSSKKSSRAVVYANAIGAALMFLSWFGQNISQSDMASHKVNVEREAQFVSSEMSKAITWMLTFQSERRKDRPDSEVLLNSASNYALTVETIVSAAGRVDPSSVVLTRHVAEQAKLMAPLKAAAAKRDISEIEQAASAMMLWFGRIGPEAHQEVNRRYLEVSRLEGIAQWAFRVCFLLGSLIFAWTWWKEHMGTTQARP